MTSQQSVFMDHCLTPNNLAQQTAILIQYTNFIVQVQCTCMCFVQQVAMYTMYVYVYMTVCYDYRGLKLLLRHLAPFALLSEFLPKTACR